MDVEIEKSAIANYGRFLKCRGFDDNKFQVYYIKEEKQFGIWDTKKDQEIMYTPEQFIYGSAMYDYRVESYPNYVHKQLWTLYEYNRILARN